MLAPFNKPINVTSPLLPEKLNVHMQIDEIWDNKWLTNNGPKHEQLTDELKEYLGADYLSLFSNGTLALLLA